jgi:hypothetical protein
MKDAAGREAGSRRITVDERDCRAIETPTSLVLAMMIGVARSEPPAPTPPPPPTSTSMKRPSDRASPSPPTASASDPHHVVVGTAGVLSTGILPDVGVGLALHARYAWRRVSAGLEASVERGATIRTEGGDVGFHLFGGTARFGFVLWKNGRLELGATANAKLALLETTAEGFAAAHDPARPVFLLGGAIRGRVAIAPSLFLEVLAGVDALLLRERFVVRGDGELFRLYRPSAVSTNMSFGVGYEF